ncbi:MAG: sensor histidine kinase [Deltaproteobacteria bacterium]|nr:sensor histidine kinase [Deltaproteobacteria bacterium]
MKTLTARLKGLAARETASDDLEASVIYRFATRSRALFFARMAFLAIGLGVLAIRPWAAELGVLGPFSFIWYGIMLAYSSACFLAIGRRFARPLTFVTLCLDLITLVYLISASGGLRSPVMPTQVVFTIFFALLFPKPLAILPPLLTLPVVARIQQLFVTVQMPVSDIFILLYYTALNFIVVYVIVYLNERDQSQTGEIIKLQGELREMEVREERNRIAREIHDGLGANLSSVVLQADYLAELASSGSIEELTDEIQELKTTVEESIDELRRSVQMMREGLALGDAMEDYCASFRERTGLDVEFKRIGRERLLEPDAQLGIFRVLQEALNNAHKHAGSCIVEVSITFFEEEVVLVVKDNGKGFIPENVASGHFGLLHMRERAKQVNGSFELESRPGQGTQVKVKIPYNSQPNPKISPAPD